MKFALRHPDHSGEFVRKKGGWGPYLKFLKTYTTVKRSSPKVGRNEPCPCGSQKKYKKCCL